MWVQATFVTIIGESAAKAWRAFFASLDGPANAFPVGATENQQTAAANPTVRAGATAGGSLPLQGLPANQTVLVAGDMLTVDLPSGHQRLIVLTAPLVTNGQGQGTATGHPRLGEAPAAGAAVEIRRPFALLRLTSEPPGWDVEPGQLYAFELQAEEAR